MNNFGYFLRRLWWSFFHGLGPVSLFIFLSTVAVFGCQLYWLYHFHSLSLDENFALSREGLKAGHYWQFVSYAWLHAEAFPLSETNSINLPIHLLANMMMFLFFARELEWVLGSLRFAILYLGGVVAAAAAWLYWSDPSQADCILGASGGVFTLMMAFAIYEPKRILQVWLLFVLPVRLSMGTLCFLLCVGEFVCLHWKLWPELGHAAHLGGALFGWIMMRLWNVRSGNLYSSDGPVSRL